MFSSLSALVDRAFIVGFVLPVLLSYSILCGLFWDSALFTHATNLAQGNIDFEDAVYSAIGIWVTALLLSLSNIFIYKTFEGYNFPSRLSKFGAARQRLIKLALEDRYAELENAAGSSLPPIEKSNCKYKRIRKAVGSKNISNDQKLSLYLKQNFPISENDVLPTRLGNILRSFERYPNHIYGADGVALWPHLEIVMGEECRVFILNIKSNVDLYINMSIILFIISFVSFIKSGCYAYYFYSEPNLNFLEVLSSGTINPVVYLVIAMFSAIAARLSYIFACEAAIMWGIYVKASFDLYINNVNLKMGLLVAQSEDERREKWLAVSRQILYHQRVDKKHFRNIVDQD